MLVFIDFEYLCISKNDYLTESGALNLYRISILSRHNT